MLKVGYEFVVVMEIQSSRLTWSMVRRLTVEV